MMKSSELIQLSTPVEENVSNLTSASNEASHVSSSSNRNESVGMLYPPQYFPPLINQPPHPIKKKRNKPGHPDPDAEVIALSPRTLMATNRFVCEVCSKGFQRDQNLQLHKRGHNLPWKLKQRTSSSSSKEMIIRKKVYVCPETSCVHHDPSRALGDLTGVKKHFSRKHGEKKWKCEKCSKKYAVHSDWKAHSKTCGTRDYRCDDCGTIFSRRDSFITHRAFCDALAVETTIRSSSSSINVNNMQFQSHLNINNINAHDDDNFQFPIKKEQQQNFNLPPHLGHVISTQYHPPPSPYISATALLQKAEQIGASRAQIHAHVSTDNQSAAGHQNMNMNMNSLCSSSYGNKVTTGSSTADHMMMMMMMNQTPHHPPPHEISSSGFYDHEDSYNFINGHEFSSTIRNEEETTSTTTRDFLGLRPLNLMMTQSDHILLTSMAAAAAAPGFCNQNQKSNWQG